MERASNIIIGIAGPSGSGKTLFTSKLAKKLENQGVTIVRADDYYESNEHLSAEERKKINYDHPNAIDQDFLVSHLKALKHNIPVNMPCYDYINNTRKKETKLIVPSRIIILEGFLVLALKNVRSLIDIKIYVDTPLDICLARRLERDVLERGSSVAESLAQYHRHVRPMFLKYLEPSK